MGANYTDQVVVFCMWRDNEHYLVIIILVNEFEEI